MKIYGIDFTDTPENKKPIACAQDSLTIKGGLSIGKYINLTTFLILVQ